MAQGNFADPLRFNVSPNIIPYTPVDGAQWVIFEGGIPGSALAPGFIATAIPAGSLTTQIARADQLTQLRQFAFEDFGGATTNAASSNDNALVSALSAITVSASGVGRLVFGPGTYLFSKQYMHPSGVFFEGMGRGITTLKVTSLTTLPGATINGALGWANLNKFDGTTTPITFVGFRDMTLDVSALGSPTYPTPTQYFAIHQQTQPLQHATFENLHFELGQNVGVQLEGLGAHATIASFDIMARDISAHNGTGVFLCYGNLTANTSYYHSVSIDTVISFIDIAVGDDRVLIAGNGFVAASGGNIARVFNISVRNVQTFVASTVTSGDVQCVKLDTGTNCYIHDVTIDGTKLYGSSAGVFGTLKQSPILIFMNSGSYCDTYVITNTYSRYATKMALLYAQYGSAGSAIVRNTTAVDCYDTLCAIEIATIGVPNGGTNILIDGFDLRFQNLATMGIDVATTGGAFAGFGGRFLISNGTVINATSAVTTNLSESSAVSPNSNTGIQVERVSSSASAANFVKWSNTANNTIRVSNCYPMPAVVTPVVPATGASTYNYGPVPAHVYLTGVNSTNQVIVSRPGTGYAIAGTVGAGPYFVDVGDFINVYYTATAPTWVWTPAA